MQMKNKRKLCLNIGGMQNLPPPVLTRTLANSGGKIYVRGWINHCVKSLLIARTKFKKRAKYQRLRVYPSQETVCIYDVHA